MGSAASEIRLAMADPEASIEAYDALEAVWRMDPYDDPGAFEARATAVAEKISGLTSATREKWYAKLAQKRDTLSCYF